MPNRGSITDIGLDYLGKAFRKRAPLQSMSFDFSRLKKLIKNVQVINYHRCYDITDAGLEAIVQSFKDRISLRHVGLAFARL